VRGHARPPGEPCTSTWPSVFTLARDWPPAASPIPPPSLMIGIPSPVPSPAATILLASDPAVRAVRNAALNVDADLRWDFVSTARNLFGPDTAIPQATVSNTVTQVITSARQIPLMQPTLGPRTSSLSSETIVVDDPPLGWYHLDANSMAVLQSAGRIPNPFLGVRTTAPNPQPSDAYSVIEEGVRMQFMEINKASKDNQVFPVPLIVRLTAILVEAKDLRFLDTIARAIIHETLLECGKYLKQISLTENETSISPGVFAFLFEYQQTIIWKLLTLCSRPLESASQCSLMAPIITFVNDYTDTRGYGTLGPIDKKKSSSSKGKSSDYRSSFRDNSGGNSSQYKSNSLPSRIATRHIRRKKTDPTVQEVPSIPAIAILGATDSTTTNMSGVTARTRIDWLLPLPPQVLCCTSC
jgi:hypothetical protein